MEKILGLDLGTNSIGWAIIEQNGQTKTLLNKGVHIFQEGVKPTKNGESPMVQDRTNARALRRHYFRRRLRKIELLKILIQHDFCPKLSEADLHEWKQNKKYPLNDDFILWQRTDDRKYKNPYFDRYRALTKTLDLSCQHDRYTLGRALYHLGQRRGFLSNRKAVVKDEDKDKNGKGDVKQGIKALSEKIKAAGCKYLGEYFYRIFGSKEKVIRGQYTARKEHYLAEFEAICQKQNLSDELCSALKRAIFYQRPLKSQKGLVGKCTFEKKKSRCPISHPRFEEFRMLQFINNIRIKTPSDDDFRMLNHEEYLLIEPLFYRTSKSYFTFEEIAKKIARKQKFACRGEHSDAAYCFNYPRQTTVNNCPVTAQLRAIFSKDYATKIASVYTKDLGKTKDQIVNDIWHVLFSFDDTEKLMQWAIDNLQLSEKEAEKFANIKMPQEYASLSLNAINKILPYLRRGKRYDESVFIANLDQVLPEEIRGNETKVNQIKQNISIELQNCDTASKTNKETAIINYLKLHVGIDDKHLKHLYHPSMIEHYPAAHPNEQGIYQLGSPRISAIRNPMAMRALFRLRHLINNLLLEGQIDSKTKIHIEVARGLNSANLRTAIKKDNDDREKKHRDYAAAICRFMGADYQPSEDEILKYQLWEEQNHICPYTGFEIKLNDFIGENPSFDIEHTVPRSRGGDNSQMNKTLCDNHFNRDTKQANLPTSLANYKEIMERIDKSFGWIEKIKALEKEIHIKRKQSRTAEKKKDKDKAIVSRHQAEFELKYWQGKLERFTMTDVPEGFSNRQGVDIGIIGRYARLYLKTVFEKIHTVKGATTAEFRKMWKIQDDYAVKDRTNHVHHCIDAITIACIGKKEYEAWASYAEKEEYYRHGKGARPTFAKPWASFTEDVKSIASELLISHYTANNMSKQSRKRIKINGEMQYAQGDTARGSLHEKTFYGAIKTKDGTKYVIRKRLNEIKKETEIENIVDDVVRQKVKAAVDHDGINCLSKKDYTIWMNEEKNIAIRKVRLYTSIANPIVLKKHRDLSEKSHKQNYYVINDSNYCMGIYEGYDKKGARIRSFELVNNLDAAQYFIERQKNPDFNRDLISRSNKQGLALKYILKIGTMVLFYENTPDELYNAKPEELVKRLYKVVGMSNMLMQKKYNYGVLTLKHNQEARQSGSLKPKNGLWKINEMYRPVIIINHNQFNALVEGYDFELSITGELKFKDESSC